MAKKLNVLGLKFGHLTALAKVGRHPTQRTAIWRWRCDCGNEREIEARRVVSGHTRTCGNCELKHKLMQETVSMKSQLGKRITREYQKYIGVAERRRLKWSLSLNEFSGIIGGNCTLCNEVPSSGKFHRLEPASHEQGYTLGKCYLRCAKCEEAFGKIGISLLIERIFIVQKYLSSLQ